VSRRPGTSLHRNGTELDLGPPAARVARSLGTQGETAASRQKRALVLDSGLTLGARAIAMSVAIQGSAVRADVLDRRSCRRTREQQMFPRWLATLIGSPSIKRATVSRR
jgi:hypothetical protein